jgi:hypothetical protein
VQHPRNVLGSLQHIGVPVVVHAVAVIGFERKAIRMLARPAFDAIEDPSLGYVLSRGRARNIG